MKAKSLVLSGGTFCEISSSDQERPFSASILLPGDMKPQEGLLQRAEEFERKAAQQSRYAAMCREAAQILK